jgi:hypothetical protein
VWADALEKATQTEPALGGGFSPSHGCLSGRAVLASDGNGEFVDLVGRGEANFEQLPRQHVAVALDAG